VQCNEGESMETRNEFITSPVMEESFELEWISSSSWPSIK
jgi:hypothetical protein